MRTALKTAKPRRPAGDLIDAILENMRANLEELRYSVVAPSRYTVYLSRPEFERLQGLLPRLRAEAIRALDEELARLNTRSPPRRALDRVLAGWGRRRPLEHVEPGWHVEFLPDFDDELEDAQDILVVSELVLSTGPDVGNGERTRRVSTVRGATVQAREERTPAAAPAPGALARVTYEAADGTRRFDVVRDSTTIGRGGLRFPVDIRVTASDDVSREHARIRHDAATGTFSLIDLSTHGTTIDGTRVPRGFEERDGGKRENGAEVPLPRHARIGLAGEVFLEFERLT